MHTRTHAHMHAHTTTHTHIHTAPFGTVTVQSPTRSLTGPHDARAISLVRKGVGSSYFLALSSDYFLLKYRLHTVRCTNVTGCLHPVYPYPHIHPEETAVLISIITHEFQRLLKFTKMESYCINILVPVCVNSCFYFS